MHRFSLPLRAPLNLACGEPLKSRDGLFLLLLAESDGAGPQGQLLGIGECCPLPGFHAESLAAAETQLLSAAATLCGRSLPRSVASLGGALETWLDIPALLPSVRCAIEMALLQLLARACECSLPELLAHSTPSTSSRAVQTHVRMNGLLVRGEQLSKADGGGAAGTQPLAEPRTLKMKVGGADGNAAGVQVAQAWRLCSARGQRLRLDANQGWTLAQVRRCHSIAVCFPCPWHFGCTLVPGHTAGGGVHDGAPGSGRILRVRRGAAVRSRRARVAGSLSTVSAHIYIRARPQRVWPRSRSLCRCCQRRLQAAKLLCARQVWRAIRTRRERPSG